MTSQNCVTRNACAQGERPNRRMLGRSRIQTLALKATEIFRIFPQSPPIECQVSASNQDKTYSLQVLLN